MPDVAVTDRVAVILKGELTFVCGAGGVDFGVGVDENSIMEHRVGSVS